PSNAFEAAMVLTPLPLVASVRDGFDSSGHHVQRLRNQSVGNTWMTLSSGPLLHTLIYINKSVGAVFAYSTNTSKYRSSLNMPVSINSYSGSIRVRCLLVFIKSR